MYKCVNGVMYEMTYDEEKTFADSFPPPPVDLPDIIPSPEERIAILEKTKADQTAVDELHEALDMILTGVTE